MIQLTSHGRLIIYLCFLSVLFSKPPTTFLMKKRGDVRHRVIRVIVTGQVMGLFVHIPANTIHWPNAGSMLGQRRRWRASIDAALGQCIVLVHVANADVQRQTAATAHVSSKQLRLFAIGHSWLCIRDHRHGIIVVQNQTAVTGYLKSDPLLLFNLIYIYCQKQITVSYLF